MPRSNLFTKLTTMHPLYINDTPEQRLNNTRPERLIIIKRINQAKFAHEEKLAKRRIKDQAKRDKKRNEDRARKQYACRMAWAQAQLEIDLANV